MKTLLALLAITLSLAAAVPVNWDGHYSGAGIGANCVNNLPPNGGELSVDIVGTNFTGQVRADCQVFNTLYGTIRGNVMIGLFANGATFRGTLKNDKSLLYFRGQGKGLCTARFNAARVRGAFAPPPP